MKVKKRIVGKFLTNIHMDKTRRLRISDINSQNKPVNRKSIQNAMHQMKDRKSINCIYNHRCNTHYMYDITMIIVCTINVNNDFNSNNYGCQNNKLMLILV